MWPTAWPSAPFTTRHSTQWSRTSILHGQQKPASVGAVPETADGDPVLTCIRHPVCDARVPAAAAIVISGHLLPCGALQLEEGVELPALRVNHVGPPCLQTDRVGRPA